MKTELYARLFRKDKDNIHSVPEYILYSNGSVVYYDPYNKMATRVVYEDIHKESHNVLKGYEELLDMYYKRVIDFVKDEDSYVHSSHKYDGHNNELDYLALREIYNYKYIDQRLKIRVFNILNIIKPKNKKSE